MKQKKKKKNARAHKSNLNPQKNPAAQRSRIYLFSSLFILLIVTFILYRPAVKHQFTNWDDPTYILENNHVKKLDLETVSYFFANPSASNYHPLTMISLSLDYSLATDGSKTSRDAVINPAPFHTTSMILFIIDVILVFLFVYLLTGRKILIAFVTAFLFAIHPMHVESVAWISERKDLLYGMFFLAGLITYVRFLQTSRKSYYLFTIVLFILSLLSKPAAVVFPLVCFAIDYYYRRKLTLRTTMEKIPMLVLAIAAGLVTYLIQSQNAVADFSTFSLFQRMLFASYGFIVYIYKLLIPVNLSAFYPYPSLSMSGYLPAIFYLSPLLVVILTGLVWFSTRFNRIIAFGYLFYLFTIVLVLQFVSVGSAIMADRYAFIPCIGLFIVIGYYFDYIYVAGSKHLRILKVIFPLVLAVYSGVLIITASKQIGIWKNSETLWSDVIRKYPTVPVAYKNRGQFYGKQNRNDDALRDYKVLIRLDSTDADVFSNLGNIYAMKGDLPQAIEAYNKAIRLDSNTHEAYMNRGITYAKNKNFERALADMMTARERNPESREILITKAYLLLDMGRQQEAIDDYNLLIKGNPQYDDHYLKRGLCYHQLGDINHAQEDFNRCIALNPNNSAAIFNLSIIYRAARQYRKALEYAQRAKSLGLPVDEAYISELESKQ